MVTHTVKVLRVYNYLFRSIQPVIQDIYKCKIFRVIEIKRQPKNLKRIYCKSNSRNNNLHTVKKSRA